MSPTELQHTNTLGVHALVFAGTWDAASAQRAAEGAAAGGYQLLEIPVFDTERMLDPALTRTLFERHGLQAACSLGLSPDADINAEDIEVGRGVCC